MLVVCLLLAGLIQVSQLHAAREVLHHAAARGARAKTVGFNWSMVEKTIRVGCIPNAGRLIEPDVPRVDQDLRDALASMRPGEVWDFALAKQPESDQHRIERTRIPDFLGSDSLDDGFAVLNYEDWDAIYSDHRAATTNMALIRVRVWQDYPLKMPAHRAFYAGDEVRMEGSSAIENHYAAYLDDQML